MNTFPTKIRNNSGFDSSLIHLSVTGINDSIADNKKQQFFNPGASVGSDPWQDTSCSVKLSELPHDSDGDALLTLPFINSGIVFLSINDALTFNGTSMPDFSNPTNPSYNTLFDKFEISFLQKDGHPFINTTNVDFFSLPLSLQQTLTDGTTTDIRNFTKSRKEILDQFTSSFGASEWSKLILKNGDSILRVVAPNKALVPPNNFDAGFFQAYVDKVWEFYGKPGNTLTVDMTEIGTKALFTGSVVTDANSPDVNKFVFSDPNSNAGNSTKVVFQKPVGDQIKGSVFGCADLFAAPDRTAQAVPAKNLGAAFNVGILAQEPGNLNLTSPTSSLAPNGWKDQRQNFYRQTMTVESGNSASEIVCFNLYSKVLHANAEGGTSGNFDGLVYGFAFDDVTGSDSTLSAPNAINAIVTIQNLQMSSLPNAPRRNEANAEGRKPIVLR